ncbi:hypothetical protein LAZ67_10000369 [Cordylochernes scorpioides]|uniref:Reverse transcriptase domain-containing protein n=1 Tax=Cordylochernes scorpioides TaxID=51811 RepID=A0ABY6KYE3_9ARAC|nr:hypothetical protein LAZ67_10000369 [Cordylochernes scorpioides]
MELYHIMTLRSPAVPPANRQSKSQIPLKSDLPPYYPTTDPISSLISSIPEPSKSTVVYGTKVATPFHTSSVNNILSGLPEFVHLNQNFARPSKPLNHYDSPCEYPPVMPPKHFEYGASPGAYSATFSKPLSNAGTFPSDLPDWPLDESCHWKPNTEATPPQSTVGAFFLDPPDWPLDENCYQEEADNKSPSPADAFTSEPPDWPLDEDCYLEWEEEDNAPPSSPDSEVQAPQEQSSKLEQETPLSDAQDTTSAATTKDPTPTDPLENKNEAPALPISTLGILTHDPGGPSSWTSWTINPEDQQDQDGACGNQIQDPASPPGPPVEKNEAPATPRTISDPPAPTDPLGVKSEAPAPPRSKLGLLVHDPGDSSPRICRPSNQTGLEGSPPCRNRTQDSPVPEDHHCKYFWTQERRRTSDREEQWRVAAVLRHRKWRTPPWPFLRKWTHPPMARNPVPQSLDCLTILLYQTSTGKHFLVKALCYLYLCVYILNFSTRVVNILYIFACRHRVMPRIPRYGDTGDVQIISPYPPEQAIQLLPLLNIVKEEPTETPTGTSPLRSEAAQSITGSDHLELSALEISENLGRTTPSQEDKTTILKPLRENGPVRVIFPLASSLHCPFCFGKPGTKVIGSHGCIGDFQKHLKKLHTDVEKTFMCRKCSRTNDGLRGMKRHVAHNCTPFRTPVRIPTAEHKSLNDSTNTPTEPNQPAALQSAPHQEPPPSPPRPAIREPEPRSVDLTSPKPTTPVPQTTKDNTKTAGTPIKGTRNPRKTATPEMEPGQQNTRQVKEATAEDTEEFLEISEALSGYNLQELLTSYHRQEHNNKDPPARNHQKVWIKKIGDEKNDQEKFETIKEFYSNLIKEQTIKRNNRKNKGANRERPIQKETQAHKSAINLKYSGEEAGRLQKAYNFNKKRTMQEILEGSSPLCNIPKKNLEAYFQKNNVPKDHHQQKGGIKIPPRTRKWQLHKRSPGSPQQAHLNRRDRRKYSPNGRKASRYSFIKKAKKKTNPENRRPIALGNTIGKLYSAIIADRIKRFATNTNLISSPQKSFLEYEGCLEHNFVLQSLIEETKRAGREICIGWIDLANAFGSVPHHLIFETLEASGIPENYIQISRDLYKGASTTIKTKNGSTSEIPILCGVKQGCSLSPITFNIHIKPIIRTLEHLGRNLGFKVFDRITTTLAYADDLVITAKNKEALDTLLDTLSDQATKAGLKMKPQKCATLHLLCRGRRRVPQTPFNIEGAPVPAMTKDESYLHLGVPTGFRKSRSLNRTLQDLETEIPPSQGGAGLLPFRDRAELYKIAQAFKMLTSKDANTENLAKIFLKLTVNRKLGRSASGEGMAVYLSGRLDQGFDCDSGDVASLWSEARNATRRLRNTLRARWTWDPDSCTLSITLLDTQSKMRTKIGPSMKHQLIGKLRQALQEYYLETLLLKRDQGKTFEVTCQNQCSTPSSRLVWSSERDPSACPPALPCAFRRVKNTPRCCLRTPKEGPENQRGSEDQPKTPQLILLPKMWPYYLKIGTRLSPPQEQNKIKKYEVLAEEFRKDGYKVDLEAFLVGSLGGWDNKNERVLRMLEVSPRYAELMRQLMCTDTIKCYRDIYVEHISGKRQYQ